jgi:hypothetical protein
MALQLIDLQAMFSQLDKVGKEQHYCPVHVTLLLQLRASLKTRLFFRSSLNRFPIYRLINWFQTHRFHLRREGKRYHVTRVSCSSILFRSG